MSKANINLSNFNSSNNNNNNYLPHSNRISGVAMKKNLPLNPRTRDQPFEQKNNGIESKKLAKNQSFTEKRNTLVKNQKISNDENLNPLLKQSSGVLLA